MDRDFLLENPTAKTLFHDHAEKMPITDYHCHINPRQIAEDYRFADITDAWLSGDHYKWRMTRSDGIPEDLITGDKSTSCDKFQMFAMFAKSLPRAIGNPPYHRTHLELQRCFGITDTLSEKTCENIWNECDEKLKDPSMSVRGIIRRSKVRCICPPMIRPTALSGTRDSPLTRTLLQISP